MNYPNRDFIEAMKKYPSTNFGYGEIIEKLDGYFLVKNFDDLILSIWYRYFHKGKGFRTGGFLIKNEKDDEFLVFKNLSKNYTWSVRKEDLLVIWGRPRMRKKKITEYYKEWIKNKKLQPADFLNDINIIKL